MGTLAQLSPPSSFPFPLLSVVWGMETRPIHTLENLLPEHYSTVLQAPNPTSTSAALHVTAEAFC